ncbi:ABC transporter permease [Candidatus Methanomassiliicoccus intestinalis]|uniref:ABC transporter permease n=1 Tax=Candidatus Methanomassiliicoccus intestinalis TaxID=1406512 RepID=UPI0037DC0C92
MSLLDSTDKIISERLADSKGDVIPLGNRAPRNFLKSAAILLIGIIFVLLVWWITSEYYNTYMIKTLRFPTPGETFDTLWYYLDSTHKLLRYTLYEHVAASMERWIKGFVLAFIIGMTLGILMGINDKIYKFGSVPVNILQMIPGLAWFPVTILLFGFGDKSAIFIIAVTVISPIAFNVAAGLRRVPQVNLRVARMSGRTRFETLTEVLLPFSLIDIIGGLRIGMANSWRMLIAAEMVVGVAVGLGYAINQTTNMTDYPAAFAGIVIICVIGLVIDKLIFANVEKYARNKLGMEESS